MPIFLRSVRRQDNVKITNSDFLNGLNYKEATKKAIEELEKARARQRQDQLPFARRGVFTPALLGRTFSCVLREWLAADD
jgi:hypothetical protein